MTVGLATVADHQPAQLFDLPGAVELVRRCLALIRDDDRPLLYERLEAFERALGFGEPALVDRVVSRALPGPIMDCLAQLAARHVPSRTLDSAAPAPPPLRTPRQRYQELRALVCPVDAWASTGLRWVSADPDCFYVYGNDTDHWRHRPVPLNWRHVRDGQPIGLSRRWWLEDDGALCARFEFASYPAAQVAADLASARLVAPSIGVRFESDWSHVDPSDWDPYTGTLDLCRHRYASVEEVSLTPHPFLPTKVTAVW
jgi:hypothetical protein